MINNAFVNFYEIFIYYFHHCCAVEVYDEKVPETEMKKFGRVSYYQGEDFIIKARTTRLNTVPFTYKLYVTVDTPVKGVVRCYIGPKYDEYTNAYHVNDNKENFVLLDVFPYEFIAGKNIVTRNSNEISFFIKDRTTYYELYKQVTTAFNGEEKFIYWISSFMPRNDYVDSPPYGYPLDRKISKSVYIIYKESCRKHSP